MTIAKCSHTIIVSDENYCKRKQKSIWYSDDLYRLYNNINDIIKDISGSQRRKIYIKETSNNFVLKGNLYPNKTVKHKFPDIDYKCKIKIDELM